uniref:Uncharacterized protein n=1 Tax=Rhizophora mucronata TaxID=61149 RepID=A0A2P2MZK6_RHIMU
MSHHVIIFIFLTCYFCVRQ